MMTIPGKKEERNNFRSAFVIGLRTLRILISSALGGGTWLSNQVKRAIGRTNKAPDTKGIQNSLKCQSITTALPTLFTTPEERLNVVQSTAPINSVVLRPSR